MEINNTDNYGFEFPVNGRVNIEADLYKKNLKKIDAGMAEEGQTRMNADQVLSSSISGLTTRVEKLEESSADTEEPDIEIRTAIVGPDVNLFTDETDINSVNPEVLSSMFTIGVTLGGNLLKLVRGEVTEADLYGKTAKVVGSTIPRGLILNFADTLITFGAYSDDAFTPYSPVSYFNFSDLFDNHYARGVAGNNHMFIGYWYNEYDKVFKIATYIQIAQYRTGEPDTSWELNDPNAEAHKEGQVVIGAALPSTGGGGN